MSDYHQEQPYCSCEMCEYARSERASEQQGMDEAMRRDAHRIFAYLERHVAPADVDTVKYLMGIDEISRKQLWLEMACSCGEDV